MAPELVGKEKPPPEGPAKVLYRAPRELIARIDRLRKQKPNLSRNDAITQLLEFAVTEHEKDARKAKK